MEIDKGGWGADSMGFDKGFEACICGQWKLFVR